MRQDQLLAVVKVLVGSLHKPEFYWTENGGSPAARLVVSGGSPLSSSEQLIVRLCWCIWSGEANADFAQIWEHLGGWRLKLIGSLLVAMAEESQEASVNVWLMRNREAPFRCSYCGPLWVSEAGAREHMGKVHVVTRNAPVPEASTHG